MDHPIWLLIPWLVVAGGVGFKCWTLTRLIRRQVLSSAWWMERFKAELERTWSGPGRGVGPPEPEQVRQTALQ
ncbi:MAG: hypothetical protein ACKO8I_04850 [Cyanobacteriota bacterium]